MTDSEDLVELAVTLADKVQDHYYDLGAILFRLKDEGHYKLVDNKAYWSEKHSGWKTFCEDKLSVSYRTAQYYLRMFEYFETMDISKEDLKGIGWSKAKELIDVTDNKQVLEACIERAKTGTLQELQSYILTFVERVGEDHREELKGKTFNFRIYEAAGETVDQILSLAAKSTNGNKNEAFFKVCVEWFQTTNPLKQEDFLKIEDEPQEELTF